MSVLAITFYELFANSREACPDKPAVIDGEEAISYAALGSHVDALADRLAELWIDPCDRVIVQLRKSPAEVVAMLAIAKAGAVVVNVNAQWTVEQLRYVAEDCGARALIVEPAVARTLTHMPLPASVERVLVAGEPPAADGFEGWEDAGGAARHAAAPRCDTDLAMIIYTSGSTGSPKGVMLSNRNIVIGAAMVARYLKLSADERLLSVLPYSFDYGLNQLTTMLLLGGTVVHQRVTMAAEIVRTIVTHGVTGVAAVPPLWAQLVRLLDETPTPLPSLRRVTNSGGGIARNILERMPAVFPGADIYLMYGLTEAFRSTYLAPELFAAKMGAIGRAIPGADVYVVKAGEGVAGPGEHGELVHRGPLVSMGYWGQPELTAAKIRPCPELAHLIGDEPVVYSGDTVRVDEDGDLWFVARADAMIKTSGFRVSPDEIEDLLCRSELVGDAVAFGQPDDELGQVVHVAVAPLAGYSEALLLQHCRRVMPHYMIPRRVIVWHEPMPRTASGKLARPDIVRGCAEEQHAHA